MATLELERAYEAAPDNLAGLRSTVSGIIIEGNPDLIEQPGVSSALDEYSAVIGSVWAEAAVSDATTRYGEDITRIARGALAVRCGSVVQKAVRVEVEELRKIMDSSPTLNRRQRFAKKMRGLFSVPDTTCPEVTAFNIFDEEIRKPQRGVITAPQDLEVIVRSSAREFITNNVLELR